MASPCQFHELGHAIAPTSTSWLANDSHGPQTSDNVSAPPRHETSPMDSQSTNWVGLALRDVVGAKCDRRKAERGGRTIIPPRLSAPPRRLKSRLDFVSPKTRPVVALN